MSIIVEYACAGCGRFDAWAQSPAPASCACPGCGATASRRYGFRSNLRSVPAASPHRGDEHHDVPGSCTLVPTAAGALAARWRGDERALHREFAAQEKAQSEGTLDRTAPVTTAIPHTHTHRTA